MIWKWLIGIAAVLVAAVALLFGIGLMLPRDHVARAARTFAAPPERVAALVREVETQPRWRKDVRAIEVKERGPDFVRYVERSGNGAIAYELREEAPGRRFRSTINDPSLPFGGYWLIDVAPEGTGTRVAIAEHGFVKNPLFRVLSLLYGQDTTAKTYLADLGRALGEKTSA
ncbi:MAG TPA: SRPBCC family protein [Allosphingosinicella sp.]|jgi:uncharacterized protein YndB with AHSA1/START domain|nr:SRPBCC family protein [Allosphingosinicella sp.]